MTLLIATLVKRDAVSSDDQVKAYIKKIMSQLNKWMVSGKISKLVIVITSKETGEHIERWHFDVRTLLDGESKYSCLSPSRFNSSTSPVRKVLLEKLAIKK